MTGIFPAGATPYNSLARDGAAGQVLWTEWNDGTDKLPLALIRAYNNTGGALTVGRPYVLVYEGDEETNPHVIVATAAITGTAALRRVVFATAATASAAFGWFAIEGYTDVLVDGDSTDVAKDDYLELVPAVSATALVKDAALTVGSIAVACEANTGAAALTRVCIMNERVALAAA